MKRALAVFLGVVMAAALVSVAPAADKPIEMTADRAEIEIIFNNLLSNAVKFTGQGGIVSVTSHRETSVIWLGFRSLIPSWRPPPVERSVGSKS